MLPASWKPTATGNLERLGSADDGGYVVAGPAVTASRLLISMGLSDNWDFEAVFRAHSGARVICLDHTVTPRFWLKQAVASVVRLRPRLTRYLAYRRFFSTPGVEHRRLCVGYDRPGGISLATLIAGEPAKSVFLKADIEGSEYRILDDIVRYADRLTGIAIEFHDIDLHRERIDDLLRRLPDFAVIALAANNFGGVDPNGDPLVIEMTIVRRDFLAEGDVPALRRPVANNPQVPAIEPAFG